MNNDSTMNNPNPHKHDFDIQRLMARKNTSLAHIPEEPQKSEPINEILERIEEDIPMPPRARGGGGFSLKTQNYFEALSLMTPCKSSFLSDPKDDYSITKAAKLLDLRVTYRIEDHRGIKLHRWWVAGPREASETNKSNQ